MSGKLGQGIKTAVKWGAGLVTATGAAVGGMLAMANKTAQTADYIDKLSERTGINREELQRWKYAAGQSGADIGKMEVGMKKLSQSMVSATEGSKQSLEGFNKLGISLGDLKNKSQSEIFDKVMKSLADMPPGAERNVLGNEMLGKSYTEMLPLLNAGSQGMDDLKNRADSLGLVMSEDAVKANVKFGDSLDDVKQSFGMVTANISTSFLPLLQSVLDWILNNMPQIQSVMQTVFGAVGYVISIVGAGLDGLFYILGVLWGWIEPNMPAIQSAFDSALNGMKKVIDDVSTALSTVIDWCVKYKDILIPLGAGIAAGAVTFGIYTLALKAATLATTLWGTITGIATTIGTAFGAVMAFITSPIGLVVIAIGLLVAAGVLLYKNWDTVKAKASELGAYLSTKFNQIKEAIMTPIRNAGEFIKEQIEKIKGFFKGMKVEFPKIKLPRFSLSGKFDLFSLPPKLPKLNVEWFDKGGIFDSPSIIGVGEKRPEFVGALDDLRFLIRDELKKDGDSGGFTLNIENFINNRKEDIKQLFEEMEFYKKQVAVSKGSG